MIENDYEEILLILGIEIIYFEFHHLLMEKHLLIGI